MKRSKRRPGPQPQAASNLQLFLCFAVFILMLITLVIFVRSVNSSTVSIISMSLICVVFAILIREPVSAAWLKKLELSFLGIRFTLERGEKQPHEMVHVTPRKGRPATTREANDLHDRGNAEFFKGNYLKAGRLFGKAFGKDSNYWPARVNQALALEKAGRYDESLSVLQSIKETCAENKYLAQAYINAGDCLIHKSAGCADAEESRTLREAAYESYRKAHAVEPASALALYHLWFGALATERHTEARKLARMIETHAQRCDLTTESLDYFERYSKQTGSPVAEELVMNRKKLLAAAVLAVVFFVAAIVLAGGYGDALSVDALAKCGILNGNV
ncbi:MAG: tetratricopeptide repeat protein [Pyrinomonadaceae bacterium]